MRGSVEAALHCTKKLMGMKTSSDEEFHEKHIEGRTPMAYAIESIALMRTYFIMEEYELALEHVNSRENCYITYP
jgi:hypothetical protein